MKSAVVKRSIMLRGHQTSVSLEDAFWQGLKEMARSNNMNVADMVADIDARRDTGNLSSTIRLYVLEYAQRAALAAQPAAPERRQDGGRDGAGALSGGR